MNILIVDDSQIIRTTLLRMISSQIADNMIYLAENAREAIASLGQHQIELVILDIQMPDGSGFEVLKAAKMQKEAPLVMMLTNYATDAYRRKAEKDGADYFFDKSTDYESLLAIINDNNNIL